MIMYSMTFLFEKCLFLMQYICRYSIYIYIYIYICWYCPILWMLFQVRVCLLVCVCVSVYVCACAHFDLCIATVGMLAIPKLFDPVVCYDMFNVVIRNFPVGLGFPKKASIKEKCQKGTPPTSCRASLPLRRNVVWRLNDVWLGTRMFVTTSPLCPGLRWKRLHLSCQPGLFWSHRASPDQQDKRCWIPGFGLVQWITQSLFEGIVPPLFEIRLGYFICALPQRAKKGRIHYM